MIHSNQLMSLKKCGIVNRETDKVNEYSDNISVKSLMHHEGKTIEGRRDISRLTSVLLGLTECPVQQDLNRNIV